MSQAGGITLVETLRVSGLDRGLSAALAPWRKPLAVHDPAKVVCDLALTLALGGDCLAYEAWPVSTPRTPVPTRTDRDFGLYIFQADL